ncbi:transporter substrate-binding domain-containing protein [Zavarzinia sp. CC-PAN008]|uniref:transporter substrate-binding domain-containing protein n=1 Tax=Zavarzinia sp. CC-PAN008 TaxID=3243332 RepID=UPI003F743E29
MTTDIKPGQTRRRVLLNIALGSAALSAGLSLRSRPGLAATLEEIKARGAFVVATEDDYKPFSYLVDGKPMGYDHAIADLLRAHIAPIELKQEIIPWTGLLAGVASGKYDMCLSAALITKERQESLDFTSPTAAATNVYIKRKADDSIKGIPDLSGKTIGVQAGSALLSKLPELEAMLAPTGGKLGEVVQYTSYPEAYQDLAIGRTDIVINTEINAEALVKERPDVFEKGLPVASTTYTAYAVAKGNAELLAWVNDFLLGLRKDGRMYALQKEHLGVSFENMPESFIAES